MLACSAFAPPLSLRIRLLTGTPAFSAAVTRCGPSSSAARSLRRALPSRLRSRHRWTSVFFLEVIAAMSVRQGQLGAEEAPHRLEAAPVDLARAVALQHRQVLRCRIALVLGEA